MKEKRRKRKEKKKKKKEKKKRKREKKREKKRAKKRLRKEKLKRKNAKEVRRLKDKNQSDNRQKGAETRTSIDAALSTIATYSGSTETQREGFDSWKQSIMNALAGRFVVVDEDATTMDVCAMVSGERTFVPDKQHEGFARAHTWVFSALCSKLKGTARELSTTMTKTTAMSRNRTGACVKR